ncbi:MAG: hypothetical protein ABSF26_07910 [Thermoguttaceae bacterium]|jgi:type I restriction enzyme S subunit
MSLLSGDVIFSLVRPYLKNIAIVPPELDHEVASTAYCVLRPATDLASNFLFHQLLQDSFIQSVPTYGSSPPSARDDEFLDLSVRVAPVPEQRRIVAKIEELFSDLDAGVAALERAKARLKRYRAAVLKAAVEGKLTEAWRKKKRPKEPGQQLLDRILRERRRRWEEEQVAAYDKAGKKPRANWRQRYKGPVGPDDTNLPALPEGWCWAALDQLLVYLRNGYFQSPSGAAEGTPILRINAVRSMSVNLSEVRFLDSIKGDANGYFVEDGDLLFTRYNGSVDLLGVAGMVRGCTEKILHPDKLIRVRVAVGQPLSSFVEIAANGGVSRSHMVRRARTTAGQTGISGTDVREMPVPLPSLDEQAEIAMTVAERLSQIGVAERLIDTNLKRSTRLRQSILKRGFEGKLVPQDPTDEPAAKLLERIAAECRRPLGLARAGKKTKNASRKSRPEGP